MKHISTSISLGMIFVSLFVLDLMSNAQARHECSVATLEGHYGFILNGTITERGLLAAVGVITFDGQGNEATAQTVVFQDTGVQHITLTGTYTVNPDCTGSSRLGTGSTHDFAIIDGGKSFYESPPKTIAWWLGSSRSSSGGAERLQRDHACVAIHCVDG